MIFYAAIEKQRKRLNHARDEKHKSMHSKSNFKIALRMSLLHKQREADLLIMEKLHTYE